MAEKAWAKEPWSKRTHQFEIDAVISKRYSILDKNDKMIIPWPGWDNPEVDRIIACVNACAGVPTEVLETPGFAKMTRIVAEIAYIGHKAEEAKDG